MTFTRIIQHKVKVLIFVVHLLLSPLFILAVGSHSIPTRIHIHNWYLFTHGSFFVTTMNITLLTLEDDKNNNNNLYEDKCLFSKAVGDMPQQQEQRQRRQLRYLWLELGKCK